LYFLIKFDFSCKEAGRKNKFDKTVRREICQITTPGTKTFNTLDNDNVFHESSYLLCVVELVRSNSKCSFPKDKNKHFISI